MATRQRIYADRSNGATARKPELQKKCETSQCGSARPFEHDRDAGTIQVGIGAREVTEIWPCRQGSPTARRSLHPSEGWPAPRLHKRPRKNREAEREYARANIQSPGHVADRRSKFDRRNPASRLRDYLNSLRAPPPPAHRFRRPLALWTRTACARLRAWLCESSSDPQVGTARVPSCHAP